MLTPESESLNDNDRAAAAVEFAEAHLWHANLLSTFSSFTTYYLKTLYRIFDE